MTTVTCKQNITEIIALTPEAIRHIKKSLSKQPLAIGIKLGVKDAGCSGKAYVIDYASDTPKTTDAVGNIDDITVIVDGNSIEYIRGSTLDCTREGINEFLKFINPNVMSECGCGESFQVKQR